MCNSLALSEPRKPYLLSASQPLNRGTVLRLGGMRYRPFASPEFMRRYQIRQLRHEPLADRPCLIFNRDDALQHQFRQPMAGIETSHIDSGQLIAPVPDYYVDVPLYWHYWRTESPIMANLLKRVCFVAADHLEQDV
jgi:LysR family transcriptional regulator (chromosome initiation inhibitor)